MLFTIYINDIATSSSPNSDANMFADDNIELYRVVKTSSDYVRSLIFVISNFSLMLIDASLCLLQKRKLTPCSLHN